MRVAFVRLNEAFTRLFEAAMLECRPVPTITTDFGTGRLILAMIAEDIGGAFHHGMRPPDWPSNLIGMFNGIKIVASREEICKHNVDGWREHFGPLADIWS